MPYRSGFRGWVAAGLTAAALFLPSAPRGGAAAPATAALFPVTLVQFSSFMAPVMQPGVDKPGLRAVTVIVEVGEPETQDVCAFMPRIRDAVLVELFRQPILVEIDTGIAVETIESGLVDPLNRALGKESVRRVYVLPGAEHMTEAAAARLPFNRVIGCRQRRGGRV